MENKKILTEIPEDIRYLVNNMFLSEQTLEAVEEITKQKTITIEEKLKKDEELKKELEAGQEKVMDFFTVNPHLLNNPVNEDNDRFIHKISLIQFLNTEKFSDFLDHMINNRKIDLNIQNNDGNTLLHEIMTENDGEAISLLYYLGKGAKFDIKNKKNQTAKDEFEIIYNQYKEELKDNPRKYQNILKEGEVLCIEKLREFFDFTIDKAIEKASALNINDKKVVERFSLKIKNFFDLEIENLLGKVNDEIAVLNDKLKLLEKASDNLFEISMQNNKENFENHGKEYYISNNFNPNANIRLNDDHNKGIPNRRNSF